jgi:hypothetical protein
MLKVNSVLGTYVTDVLLGAGVVVLLVWVGLGILWMVLATRFRSGRRPSTTPTTTSHPPQMGNPNTAPR